MIINFKKSFLKEVSQLKTAQKTRFKKALILFEENPKHYSLYNHSLCGEWKGHRSITFGGDWRAHYIQIDENEVIFVAVGTHSQLYK